MYLGAFIVVKIIKCKKEGNTENENNRSKGKYILH